MTTPLLGCGWHCAPCGTRISQAAPNRRGSTRVVVWITMGTERNSRGRGFEASEVRLKANPDAKGFLTKPIKFYKPGYCLSFLPKSLQGKLEDSGRIPSKMLEAIQHELVLIDLVQRAFSTPSLCLFLPRKCSDAIYDIPHHWSLVQKLIHIH